MDLIAWIIGHARQLRALVVMTALATAIWLIPCAYSAEWIYTVRPGDNLWDLSEKYLIDMRYWRKLQFLNRVQYPRHMPPGMTLRFPVPWLRKEPATAQVIAANGKVEAILGASGQTVPLAPDRYLRAGDAIRTGPDGNVTLKFVDNSRLLLQADSFIILETLNRYGDTGLAETHLRLEKGRTDTQVKQDEHPATRYEIRTPAAISSVRGTDYRVSMDARDPVSTTEVTKGNVGVLGAGRRRAIKQGFGTVVETGKPPIPPVRLLPAPDTSQLPAVVERVPIAFEVPSVKGARAYRLQISATPTFTALLFDAVSGSPEIVGPDLPDGRYTARFRAIDRLSLEGENAYHPFTLNARPEPPVLISPAHQSTVREKRPLFEWSEPAEAAGYNFQLADNAEFNDPIVALSDHRQSRYTPERDLEAGSYFWRVATRLASGEVGPYGDAQPFILRPAPASPTVQAPEVGDGTIVFRWSAAPTGQKHQFQLTRDWNFSEIMVDEILSEPQITLRRPPSGYYYLRIRTIDSDGYAGPYGAIQRINVPPASYWPLGIIAAFLLVVLL